MSRSLVGVALALLAGCSALLPTEETRTHGLWASYAEAQRAFDAIRPRQTTLDDLRGRGIVPGETPNVTLLNYADVARRFLPDTAAVSLGDLDPGIQECLHAKTACGGLQIHEEFRNTERKGNFFLEIFGFKRETETHGWSFDGLVLHKDGVVLYKLAGGQPRIHEHSEKSNPLGPVQAVVKKFVPFF